tara:strand:- start:612 stop:713 length:102 start_codon:yes stop_codon:yes gene_type:complete
MLQARKVIVIHFESDELMGGVAVVQNSSTKIVQ